MQNSTDANLSQSTHRIGTFQSLAHFDYRWLFIGSSALHMAMNMQMISRGWLILRLSNDSPLALAMVMVAFAAPMAILSPLGGALADRGDKKKLIVGCMLVNTVMTLLLAVLDMFAFVRYWHLLAIGVVNGTMMAINVPSRQSLIADVIPRDMLMNAISLHNSAMNLARIAGPALAGILIVYIQTWGVFYVISLSYLLSALFMLRITPTRAPKPSRSNSFTREVRQGFTYVVHHGSLRAMMLIMLFSAFCQFGVQSLLPVWAKAILDAQSDGLGYLVTTSGVGALVGSLYIAAHSNIKRKGLALIVITGIGAASTALLATSHAFGSALPILFVNGLTSAVGMALTMTLIQIHVDEMMRGRVLSISMMTFSLAPLGVAPMGIMAEHFGTPAVFGTIGLGLMVFILLFALVDRKFKAL